VLSGFGPKSHVERKTEAGIQEIVHYKNKKTGAVSVTARVAFNDLASASNPELAHS
jgi:hypothetical protein